MKWFLNKILSILEFKPEGFIYKVGSLSLVFSPWFVLIFLMSLIKENHLGYYPEINQMHFFEIVLIAIGVFWALSSVYFLVASPVLTNSSEH